MATLTTQIYEIITLNGDNVGSSYVNTINNINYIDNRNMSCPSGSTTEIFKFSNVPGAGQFVTSSFQYGRITNLSTVPIQLYVSSSTANASFLVSTGSSFMLSTSQITGSISPSNFSLNDIHLISVAPSGAAAQIEYFIATT